MKKIGVAQYRETILSVYKENQGGRASDWLSVPTETKVRDAIVHFCKGNLSKEDEYSIRAWYQVGEDVNLVDVLEKQTAGNKFKSLRNFLVRGKGLNDQSLNVIAILIDFQPRPFSVFRLNWKPEMIDQYLTGLKSASENGQTNSSVLLKKEKEPRYSTPNQPRKKLSRSWQIFLIVLLGVILSASGIWGLVNLNDEKTCLAWMGGKYHEVSCNTEFLDQKGIVVQVNNGEINISNFRQIQPNRNTEFYEADGSPKVWYANNLVGKQDFFNSEGRHPVTNEKLKPVPMTLVAMIKGTEQGTVEEKTVSEQLNEDQSDGDIENEMQELTATFFINKSVVNSETKEIEILSFIGSDLDVDLNRTLKNEVVSSGNSSPDLFYTSRFSKEVKLALKQGDFSVLPRLEKYVDEIWIINATYTYKESSVDSKLSVCILQLNGTSFNTRTGVANPLNLKHTIFKGSGFSEIGAKQNTLTKISL